MAPPGGSSRAPYDAPSRAAPAGDRQAQEGLFAQARGAHAFPGSVALSKCSVHESPAPSRGPGRPGFPRGLPCSRGTGRAGWRSDGGDDAVAVLGIHLGGDDDRRAFDVEAKARRFALGRRQIEDRNRDPARVPREGFRFDDGRRGDPIAASAEQFLAVLGSKKRPRSQRGVWLRLPTRPSGSGKERFLGSAGCSTRVSLGDVPVSSAPELSWIVVVSWKGWLPARVSGSPPPFRAPRRSIRSRRGPCRG